MPYALDDLQSRAQTSSPKFTIMRCGDWMIRGTVERDHYLHKWPHPSSLPFGYCLCVNGRSTAPDGRPWGIALFKKLQHHKQADLFGYEGLPTAWQVLDLARVWVHPDLQRRQSVGENRKGERVIQSDNVFSRMVSMAIRRVQADWLLHHPPVYPHLPYHIERIVSYCELAHHDGTGYRAANFTRWGMTTDGEKEIYLRKLSPPRSVWQPALLPVAEGAFVAEGVLV